MPGYATLNTSSNPFNIGNKKQLFLDDMLVQSSKGVTPTLNFPQVPKENLVPQDKPWEEMRVGGFSSVLEHNGAYHFWYTAYGGTGDEREQDGGPRLHCYAVSTDGIHWEKPDLGLIPFRGSKDNNIVMAYVFGQTFVDPFDDDSRRFKMISWIPPRKYGWRALEKIKGRNIYLAYSPDGIHWDLEPEPVLPFLCGRADQHRLG